MRKTFIFLLTLFSSIIIAQTPVLEWSKVYGGSGTDLPLRTISTLDGGNLIFGNTNSTNGDFADNDGGADIFILKTNPTGEILWSKTYGGSGIESFKDVAPLDDGTYTIVGTSSSRNGDVAGNYGLGDVWLFQIDEEGTIIWNMNYGSDEVDNGGAIISTDDGGFIVVGEQRNNVDYMRDGYVFKINADKELVWEKTFGGSNNDHFNGIEKKLNGNFLISGYTNSNNGDISDFKGSVDAWVVEIDSDGNLIWSKTFGGTQLDFVYSTIQNNSSEFLIVGHTMSTNYDITDNNGGNDAWVIKLNQDGNVIWSKTYGGSEMEFAQSITQLPEGGYMITGVSESNDGDLNHNYGERDVWLFQIDEDGELVWQSNLGGSLEDEGTSISIVDQKLFVAAKSFSSDGDVGENKGDSDVWLMKFNLEKLSTNEMNLINISVYPNPVKDYLYISSDQIIKEIKLYDISGKEIIHMKTYSTNSKLNMESFNPGIYTLQIIKNASIQTKKMIKL